MLRKEPKQPKPPDDELTARLRASLAQKRSRPYKAILIGVTLLIAVGTVLAWWFYPGPEPPPSVVIAFDQVALPGEPVKLRARLAPSDPDGPAPRLDGWELTFETGLLGEIRVLGQATTDATGEATLFWQPPPEGMPTTITVRFPGDRRRKESSSQARVFTFRRDAAVLLVDVAALAKADVETWRTRNILEIPPTPGAAAALTAARRKGFHPIYLAQTVDAGRLYGQARGWVHSQLAGKDPLPPGPTLGRGSASDPAGLLGDLLDDMKQTFSGPVVAVTADSKTAEAFQKARFTTLLLSDRKGAPPGIRLASWSDLDKRLHDAGK
jgi:hypothetical protein